MKKIAILTICCLFLCGCGKEKELSLSELTIEYNALGWNTVSGTVKNETDKAISSAKIVLTLKSGELTQQCHLYIMNVNANEIKKIDEENIFCDEIKLTEQSNLENYKIVDKKIEYIYYE